MMDKHSFYLEELIKNLHKVDEDINETKLIVTEGQFYKPHTKEQYKLNDLILFYYNDDVSLIELKSSQGKRSKAIDQLQSGYNLVRSMGYENIRSKIVYYNIHTGYSFEEL